MGWHILLIFFFFFYAHTDVLLCCSCGSSILQNVSLIHSRVSFFFNLLFLYLIFYWFVCGSLGRSNAGRLLVKFFFCLISIPNQHTRLICTQLYATQTVLQYPIVTCALNCAKVLPAYFYFLCDPFAVNSRVPRERNITIPNINSMIPHC